MAPPVSGLTIGKQKERARQYARQRRLRQKLQRVALIKQECEQEPTIRIVSLQAVSIHPIGPMIARNGARRRQTPIKALAGIAPASGTASPRSRSADNDIGAADWQWHSIKRTVQPTVALSIAPVGSSSGGRWPTSSPTPPTSEPACRDRPAAHTQEASEVACSCSASIPNTQQGHKPDPPLTTHCGDSGESLAASASFIEALQSQRNERHAQFINSYAKFYERAFQTFFNSVCECCEVDEPENAQTLQEVTEILQKSLPPFATVFGEKGAYLPEDWLRLWPSILSDSLDGPLSLRKSAVTEPVAISRQWDVDSIWLAANGLDAILQPNVFHLCFLPSPVLNLSTEQVIQPHGLNLAKTRHILLGTFSTHSARFSAFVFFPNAARCFGTNPIKNALPLERQEDLYDNIIIPAANETILHPSVQELPRNYHSAFAKVRSFQERPGNSRWRADDVSRSVQLKYAIPARFLRAFWGAIVRRTNLFRFVGADGSEVPYFQGLKLVFQSHDLKNMLGGELLKQSLCALQTTVLDSFDPAHLDLQSCWLDIGTRDMTSFSAQDGLEVEPYTLLWKSGCHQHLHDRLWRLAPDTPLDSTFYRSFLLRDTGCYQSKARTSRKSHPGHSHHGHPGTVRAKAYSCNKELFSVMYSDYRIFSSEALSLLALNEQMMRGLSSTSQGVMLMPGNHPNRTALQKAWEANKRHVRAISAPTALTNYGVRKEMTFRLDVILTMWHRGDFDNNGKLHLARQKQSIPLAPGAGHSPFFVLRTKDVNSFIFTQASRFIVPLEYLFQNASRSRNSYSPSLILAFYTAQLFCRLLKYSLSSQVKYSHDNWIWLSKWRVQTKQSCLGSTSLERCGLGVEATINNTGIPWIPPSHMNFCDGHIALETLSLLYIPRIPSQPRLLTERNVKSFITSKVSIEHLARRWLHEARVQFDHGNRQLGAELAQRTLSLAVEEVARSYHVHMLSKLQIYWARVFSFGRKKAAPPCLHRLKLALEEASASRGRIVTAQTIWEVYSEAWGTYTRVPPRQLPEDLPRWMLTRRLVSPHDGWSEFVFRNLFNRQKVPSWNNHDFLELYRKFRHLWEIIVDDAGSFEDRFCRVIGNFILVSFNSDNSKEIGTASGAGSFYEDQPTFFRIQFWAPYFTPPKDDVDCSWASVADYENKCPKLSPSALSQNVDAARFQDLEDSFRSLWSQIVVAPEGLHDVSIRGRNKIYRAALRALACYVGPHWLHDNAIAYVRPWSVGSPEILGTAYEDPFHVAFSAKTGRVLRKARTPTIMLPCCHNVMMLVDAVLSMPDVSHATANEAKRLQSMLKISKDYSITGYFEAKSRALAARDDANSLLERFLSQTQPPQEIVQHLIE